MAESSGRTRQENMMADYSDWAWDSDGGSAAAKALLVFSSMVATIGIVVLLPQRLGVDLRSRGVSGWCSLSCVFSSFP